MDLRVDDPGHDDLDRGLGVEAGVERLSPGERLEALGREGRLARCRGQAAPERGRDRLAPLLERIDGFPLAERACDCERLADLVEGVGAAHAEASGKAESGSERVEHVGRRVLLEDGRAKVSARAEAVERGRDEARAEQVSQAGGGMGKLAGLVGAPIVVGLASRGVWAVGVEAGEGGGLVVGAVADVAREGLEAVGAGVGVGGAGGDGAALGGGTVEGVGAHGDCGMPGDGGRRAAAGVCSCYWSSGSQACASRATGSPRSSMRTG